LKTIVFVFHPDITISRVNKALAKEIGKQENVTVHYVYEAYPNEKIDVRAEQNLLEAHDRIILQFPLYWYSSPPLLKKWLDEILTHGWAYGSKGKKLHKKELLLAVTAGDSKESFTPNGSVKFSLNELLRPFQATSNIIGTSYLEPFTLYKVGHLTDEELSETAKQYVTYALNPKLEKLAD